MKAVTVEPKKPETARYEDFPEPDARDGSILVEAVAVGVCGTDVEIVEGKYGWAPEGATRLVLGHESLGRVIDPGFSSAFKKGDLVVGIVRRPDPVPCPACAVGEWDMCRNDQYTERGIKQIVTTQVTTNFGTRGCEPENIFTLYGTRKSALGSLPTCSNPKSFRDAGSAARNLVRFVG